MPVYKWSRAWTPLNEQQTDPRAGLTWSVINLTLIRLLHFQGFLIFCALTFSQQVRNSLMKREDEADAEKKKLQNRCQNLEAKLDLLLSAKVNSRKNVKTTSLSMDQNQRLNPESKSIFTYPQSNQERNTGKAWRGTFSRKDWTWGDEAGIHTNKYIHIHTKKKIQILQFSGQMVS